MTARSPRRRADRLSVFSLRWAPWMFTMVLSLGWAGCNGSKAFTKRAAKLEEAGMMTQAANLYYTAVVKKPSNLDAAIGLKRSGQVVLGQHIASFDEAVAYNNREGAIAAWQDAEAWSAKLKAVGADLAFPEAKRAQFESVKNAHLDDTYREANKLLMRRVRQVGVAVGFGGKRYEEAVSETLGLAFGRDVGAPLEVFDLRDLLRQPTEGFHDLRNIGVGRTLLKREEHNMPQDLLAFSGFRSTRHGEHAKEGSDRHEHGRGHQHGGGV